MPDSYMGDVIGDLNKRRGRVMGMDPTGDGSQVITAEVPMAEMGSYAIDLRSMTQSRAASPSTSSATRTARRQPRRRPSRGEGPAGGGGEVRKAVRASRRESGAQAFCRRQNLEIGRIHFGRFESNAGSPQGAERPVGRLPAGSPGEGHRRAKALQAAEEK